MAKDVPDNWDGGGQPDLGVAVIIPQRHAFVEFAGRQHHAFALAHRFGVTYGTANTTVTFMPYSKELASTLWSRMEHGETLKIGNSWWTLERSTLQGFG